MGHLGAKDAYRMLGRKIDGLETRSPWNGTLARILEELYTVEEAELASRMPYGLSNLERIARLTGFPPEGLAERLSVLAGKGLVVDVWTGKEYLYCVAPMVIGIFESTMMRTRGQLDFPTWARLFADYMDEGFYRANSGNGQMVSPLRALPHEGAFEGEDYLEVLDYERAKAIVESSEKISIGICSCRHEALHLGVKKCDTPLETCTSFGFSADYLIRNGLARPASKTEALELVALSRERGLTLCADNVQKNVSFICHCCKCCCKALAGIRDYGYASSVMTSNFIARRDPEKCSGCGACAKACTIDAITMVEVEEASGLRAKVPVVDEAYCLGCGVCAVSCPKGAMRLKPRENRVLHPENVFERVILRSLENGTLQNQIFDDPGSMSQKFLRGLVGGFLRLAPVKRGLMSDALRSSFLGALTKARGGV